MTDPEIRLQAAFDQINASHRDCLAAVARTSRGLFLMDPSEREAFLNDLDPIGREVLRNGAKSLGDRALLDTLNEVELT